MARKVGGYGLSAILLVVAIVLFLLAAFGYDLGQTKVDLGLLGLAFFAGAQLA